MQSWVERLELYTCTKLSSETSIIYKTEDYMQSWVESSELYTLYKAEFRDKNYMQS